VYIERVVAVRVRRSSVVRVVRVSTGVEKMRFTGRFSSIAVTVLATSAFAAGMIAPMADSFVTAVVTPAVAPDPASVLRIEPKWTDAFTWRSIGPANMGGRITDIAVYEADPTTYYVATASGGLLKTTNNGVTYEHQFDDQATVSIGAVAVAQSDPNIVWVGTGEANPRNSVSWGDGVYKSTDAGKTWKNMGLKETFQIGQLVIHPENPDVVYVGAMGRCWGENEERGLYKTTDGGETWDKVLYIDQATGVIDVAMDPSDPESLLVATWERQRDGFDTNDPAKKWGAGSGLYKTTDGGASFTKITDGLPSVYLGRMSLSYHVDDPNIVYATVDSERIGTVSEELAFLGIVGEDADAGARLTEITEESPAEEAGLQKDDIVIRVGDEPILSYEAFTDQIGKRLAGDKMTLTVSRDRESVEIEVTLGQRSDAGEGRPHGTRLGGQRPNVQDEQGPDSFERGGLYRSDNGGDSWHRVNSYNPRPMYFSRIAVDPSDSDTVWICGISFGVTEDGGETVRTNAGPGVHADQHAIWVDPNNSNHLILGCDGGLYVTYDKGKTWDHHNHMAIGQFYHVTVDPRERYMVYGGLQDNGSWGGPNMTRSGSGPINSDWFRVGGGDGFLCLVDKEDPDQIYFESQNGGMGRTNFATGARGSIRPRAPQGTRYRFNWRTPFALSHFNSRIYYTAGNHVFRSLDKGNRLKKISPEITNTDRGSATALAESPREEEVLYVGTDDGALWATRDGGATWANLFEVSAEEPEDEKSQEPKGIERIIQSLLALDKDGDGTIAKDDVPERLAKLFGRIDSDEDGSVTKDEVDAFRARMGGGREHPTEKPTPEPAAAPAEEPPAKPAATPSAPDRVSGTWVAKSDDMPGGGEIKLKLKLGERGKVEASLDSPMFTGKANDASFKPSTSHLELQFEGEFGPFTIEGKIGDDALTGQIIAGSGGFQMDFEAKRTDKPAPAQPPILGTVVASTATEVATPAAETVEPRPIAELIPGPRWVSSIEASRHKDGRVYVTFDGHRSDDDSPYVFVSEDYGQTWRSINANLPVGTTRVIREDLENDSLLYLGTEFGAWASISGGRDWTSLNSNLPTVAIHELAQHPTSGDLIAATHGRSIWILDVTTLRQMNEESLTEETYLFKPNRVTRWRREPSRGISGVRVYQGQNPNQSAEIAYMLSKPAEEISLKIVEADGTLVRDLGDVSGGTGLHSVRWDLRKTRQSGNSRFGGRFRGGSSVSTGTYRVVLTVDGQVSTQDLVIRGDPDFPQSGLASDDAFDEFMEEEAENEVPVSRIR
jgi:photosystem II stability/assembly factor-like uncharacterized protein